jgi:hypothetical protein
MEVLFILCFGIAWCLRGQILGGFRPMPLFILLYLFYAWILEAVGWWVILPGITLNLVEQGLDFSEVNERIDNKYRQTGKYDYVEFEHLAFVSGMYGLMPAFWVPNANPLYLFIVMTVSMLALPLARVSQIHDWFRHFPKFIDKWAWAEVMMGLILGLALIVGGEVL